MSDYSEQGAMPVEDAAVEDPPTVDEVADRQRREFPEQARTSIMNRDQPPAAEHPVGAEQARENAELDPPA